ncbi:MAG: hypothetical protein Aurels2KO_39470 [Aureliella sp.]
MDRHRDPQIRVSLELSQEEEQNLRTALEEQAPSIVPFLSKFDLQIEYCITYLRSEDREQRQFTLGDVKLPRGTLVLKPDAPIEGDEILLDGSEGAVPLHDALLITKSDLEANRKRREAAESLASIVAEREDYESLLNKYTLAIEELRLPSEEAVDADAENGETRETEESQLTEKISAIEEKLSKTRTAENRLATESEGCEIYGRLEEASDLIDEHQERIEALEEAIAELENSESNATTQKSLRQKQAQLRALRSRFKEAQATVDSLQLGLDEKYSAEASDLGVHLTRLLHDSLAELLPRVVVWKHSEDYILEGETSFSLIQEAESLESIPRPLFNLFRLGLEIPNLAELKATLLEIEEDSSERSRYQDRMNRKIDEYLKSVWQDYDQKIKITLEQEQIRIEFFDPENEDASYYTMQERSQGCQTFVSFLLTIGAEAKHGFIKETVLLLDEPEIHLHPSGVRFMLRELIRAASNSNLVVFATHSIFMIDREDIDRHVIVKKTKEITDIIPSQRHRIGFFMQEEVLYSALDVNLDLELGKRAEVNFVFEGHGDAVLFESHYRSVLRESSRPFPLTKSKFYHGGKCSDILKYFKHNPIQLGAKWIFILDSDGPANQLSAFLNGKYRDFFDRYIYVFQFSRDNLKGELELEDLIEATMIKQCLKETAKLLSLKLQLDQVDDTKRFAEYIQNIDGGGNGSEWKALFKDILNQEIEQKSAVKNQREFEAAFPKFMAWANDVAEKLCSQDARGQK